MYCTEETQTDVGKAGEKYGANVADSKTSVKYAPCDIDPLG